LWRDGREASRICAIILARGRPKRYDWPHQMGGFGMLRRLGIAACFAVAIAVPVHDAVAQDAVGGAIIGGVGGAILGGALGGGRGAAIGAVVGAGTGAAIASEGERRRSGYYAYQRGCYMQRPDGRYVPVDPRYCY
jgi:hypothetical protein